MADLYERARPEYPPRAIAWLADKLELRPGRTALDLGAGTGKLTRALMQTGVRVIAIEPGDAMRAELRRAVPDAEALRGAAEAIPLPDGSVDAVAVGQAFHWFRHDEALPEIRRVLRSGGGLGLIWNDRDPDDPLHEELGGLLAPFVPPGRGGSESWTEPLLASTLFGPLEKARFTQVQDVDSDGLVERIASTSFVAAASEERRSALHAQLRDLVAARGGRVTLAYVTRVYVSRAAV